MTKKIKILLLIFSLSLTLSYMSNTYSRYVADATGNVNVLFAKWQILVNDSDITNETTSSIEITPVIYENENVAQNTIAPSSKGYFDIVINPENVGVSFEYDITLDVLNENMPDLLITNYSILKSDYIEGQSVDVETITDNVITGTMNYDNTKKDFKYEAFTIRVYFEWFEGNTDDRNEEMNDEADTLVANDEEVDSLEIEAKITFKQKLA